MDKPRAEAYFILNSDEGALSVQEVYDNVTYLMEHYHIKRFGLINREVDELLKECAGHLLGISDVEIELDIGHITDWSFIAKMNDRVKIISEIQNVNDIQRMSEFKNPVLRVSSDHLNLLKHLTSSQRIEIVGNVGDDAVSALNAFKGRVRLNETPICSLKEIEYGILECTEPLFRLKIDKRHQLQGYSNFEKERKRDECRHCLLSKECCGVPESDKQDLKPLRYKELKELRQMLIDSGVKYNEGYDHREEVVNWTVDSREVLMSGRGAELIGKVMHEKLKLFDCTHVAGPQLSGIPLVSFVMHESEQSGKPLSGLIVRRQPKNGKIVEGNFDKDSKVVAIDDLTNSGSTAARVRKALEGTDFKGYLFLVHFGNRADKELVRYVFDLKDLMIENPPEAGKNSIAKIVWSHECNLRYPKMSGYISSPVYHDGLVLCGTQEGIFYAFSADTGRIVWQYDCEVRNWKGILSTPCLHGGSVIFGAYNGYLYRLNATDGSLLWKTKVTEQIGSSPIVFEDKVYVGLEWGMYGGALGAFDLQTGGLLWFMKTKNMMHSSPNVDVKRRLVIAGCNDGFIYCTDVSGKLKWKFEVGLETRGKVAIDEEKALLYWGSETGCIYCADISGKLVWKRHVGLRLFTNPEIVGDNLVFSTVSRRVFCLDRFTGSIRWYYNTRARIYSLTSTLSGTVHFSSMDGYFYLVDLKSGGLIRKYRTGLKIMTRPLIIGRRVYAAGQGSVCCFEL